MKNRALLVAIMLMAAGTYPLLAQTNYAALASFGFETQLGHNPEAPLVEDTAGILYGTMSGGFGGVFRIAKGGANYRALIRFSGADGAMQFNGFYPAAGLTLVSNNLLFGTCSLGGTFGAGTLFRLSTSGTGFVVLHHFTNGSDGGNPVGELLWLDDGFLYGHTVTGGSNNQGIVFRIKPDGSEFQVVRDYGVESGSPHAGLTAGNNEWLYGTSAYGGSEGAGAIFKLKRNGTELTVLHHFSWDGIDGTTPSSRLLEASDGALYGTTQQGGTAFAGTLFRINPDGGGYAILKNFAGAGDGGFPVGGLMEGSDGALYGVCPSGGTFGSGTLFKIAKSGAGFSTTVNFNGTSGQSAFPSARLHRSSDGFLYGVSPSGGLGAWHICCGGTVFRVGGTGSGYTLLRGFSQSGFDGREIHGRLTHSSDGYLYGTTRHGGDHDRGTLFRIRKNGTGYTLLRRFLGSGGDAMYPEHGVIEASDGVLYGTTYSGGSPLRGTVFKISKAGSGFTPIKVFQSSGGDGQRPRAGLVEASDGFLYGTTSAGGTSGGGTIFKLGKNGSGYAIIKHFAGGMEGSAPAGSLIQGSDGALYGATTRDGSNGVGVVFRINPDGAQFGILAQLPGMNPLFGGELAPPNPGPLLEASDGRLYGVSCDGGSGAGIIYRLNKDGTAFTVLRAFQNQSFESGRTPVGGLTEGADGLLYGCTAEGGTTGLGFSFRISRDGSFFETLRQFSGIAGDGATPRGGFAKDVDGTLYGTTSSGGLYANGMMYLLGSSPTFLVQPEPVTNTVGNPVSLSGTAAGVPVPVYQWYHEGVLLSGATNALLQIPVLSVSNAGAYILVASNLIGSVTSQVATVTVDPLVAKEALFFRTAGLALRISVNDLLTNVAGLPMNSAPHLVALGASAAGANIETNAAYILYTSSNDQHDSFTYTVQNEWGRSATGTIFIQVNRAVGNPITEGRITRSGTTTTVQAFGIPGQNYLLETATNLHGFWWVIATNRASLLDGLILFTDPHATNSEQYYRLAQP